MRNKIGLVTLYQGNFGSSLQAYSSKCMIERMGFKCDVIYKKSNYFQKIKRRIVLIKMHFIDPRSANKKFYLRDETRKLIQRFVYKELNPVGYTTHELNDIDNKEEYTGFIVGSDQVWNLNNYPDNICFLKFARNKPKIAFAVSVGGCDLSKRKRKYLKKNIRQFVSISVREEFAHKVICGLFPQKVELICDPTIMFNTYEWKDFSKNGLKLSYDYVLMHFIDKPSVKAIKFIDSIQKKFGIKMICFGYYHDELRHIPNFIFLDGSPVDYVSLIFGAKFIVTDSYHTSLFSIYNNISFRVFGRQYQTKYNQDDRILYLLRLFGLNNLFDNDRLDIDYNYEMVNKKIAECRIITTEWLKKSLDCILEMNNDNKKNGGRK
ncbi:MAG: polysaccharide pyruvyl transferase family protein [Lachnospiraceae bacterium]|nr:polysaccharide pyruvyl transferase family protein [Lachnospiraceae bacterium]